MTANLTLAEAKAQIAHAAPFAIRNRVTNSLVCLRLVRGFTPTKNQICTIPAAAFRIANKRHTWNFHPAQQRTMYIYPTYFYPQNANPPPVSIPYLLTFNKSLQSVFRVYTFLGCFMLIIYIMLSRMRVEGRGHNLRSFSFPHSFGYYSGINFRVLSN